MEIQLCTARRLPFGEHGDICLCNGTQRFLLRLGIFEGACQRFAPVLHAACLLIEILIVLFEIFQLDCR